MRGPNLEDRHGSWGHGRLTGNHQEKELRTFGAVLRRSPVGLPACRAAGDGTGSDHGIHGAHGQQPAGRDHRGSRRGALVHRGERAQDRPDHDRRRHHGVPDPDHPELAGRDHRRSGRESVVHRVRRQPAQGRPADARGSLHGMGASARRAARRDHGRARWGDLVHGERRGKIGRITTDGTYLDEYPARAGFRPGTSPRAPTGGSGSPIRGQQGRRDQPGGPANRGVRRPGSDPSGIAASGGSIWFTMHGLDKIGRISTVRHPWGRIRAHRQGPLGHRARPRRRTVVR